MVKMPDTILRNLSAGTDRTISVDDVKRAFIFNGYGLNAAKKWIRVYIEHGALEVVQGDDPNAPLRLRSIWW